MTELSQNDIILSLRRLRSRIMSLTLSRIRTSILLLLGAATAFLGGRQMGDYALRVLPLNFGERAMIATCIAMAALSVFLWIFQFVPGTLIPANRSRLLNFAIFYLGPLLAIALTLYVVLCT